MLTLRLSSRSLREEYIDSLLNALKRHPGACDEVWFSTCYGFPPLEIHRECAEKIAFFADRFRAAGIRVSLQLSNSVGHGAYMSSCDCTGLIFPGSPARPMVGEAGQTAGYCWCWNGEYFRDYTAKELAIYARLVQPASFWFDDDLRAVNHAPVNFGCFCPECLSRFNSLYDARFDRTALLGAIHKELPWRRRWTDFVRNGMADLTRILCEAVHREAPECRVSLQNGANNAYIGSNLNHILNTMQEVTGLVPGYRAGGGTYSDHDPNDVVKKGDDLAYQHWFLPECITELRPEIENHPDVAYGKSPAGTCLETSYYLAMGASAMSYAMICTENEPMDWHEKEFDAFQRHRVYWEALAKASRGTRQGGLQVVLPKEGYLAEKEGLFEYAWLHYSEATPLRYLGIPLAYSHDNEGVFLLHGSNAASLNDSEISRLLSRPLVLDAEALHIISERGYDCGGNAIPTSVPVGAEIWTDHPVNGVHAGRTWGFSLIPEPDWEIIPTDGSLEPLSRYCRRNETDPSATGGVNAAILHPSGGGTWAVFGKNLWNRTVSEFKRRQILDVVSYISGAPLCAELCTPSQAVLLPRLDGYAVSSCSVLNCSVGDSGPLKLMIRSPRSLSALFLSQYQEPRSLSCTVTGDGRVSVTLPNLRPWSVGTVFFN